MRSPRHITIALAIAVCALVPAIGRSAHAAGRSVGSPGSLQNELTVLARQARPGTLGITVSDLQTGKTWRVNADRPYPMMSVFKAPLGATVLSEVDSGRLSLDQAVIVRRSDLMTAGVSEIAATFHGDQETFTVQQLLAAAVSHSDNTAADVLLTLAGGPRAVTGFLRAHGILHMRVDRSEAEIAQQFHGLGGGVPAGGEQETAARRHEQLRRGYEAYLKDPRDRATPDAAALFLRKLWRGELLSPASTRHLLDLLYAQAVPDRLRAGIPADIRLADKCGTSYTIAGMTAAFNDIGILTWPNGHTVIVAAFLTDSHAPETRMNTLFKTIAASVTADLRPAARAAGYDRSRSSSSSIGHSGR
ncbi:MAG: class A beta-lactamase [Acetobacteraceae bacterium]